MQGLPGAVSGMGSVRREAGSTGIGAAHGVRNSWVTGCGDGGVRSTWVTGIEYGALGMRTMDGRVGIGSIHGGRLCVSDRMGSSAWTGGTVNGVRESDRMCKHGRSVVE